MNPTDIGTVLESMRRELRANSTFRKLSTDDQAWLVERLATSDYGTLAQLQAAVEGRFGGPFGATALHALKQSVQARLLKIEGLRTARREIVDRLTAGSAVAADIENLAKRALPGLTQAIAGLLGDEALNLVAKGGDPEDTREVLSNFLAAAAGARADRDITRKEDEAKLAQAKFAEDLRSKVDAGLDALYEEIKGNDAAEDLFGRLKAVVRKELAPA